MQSSMRHRVGVIVLGDHETGKRADMLTQRANERGAVITEIRTFDPGEAGSHDDLADVDAVVTALTRAIGTKTDIWAPFPMDDLGREQHVRRLSLVLQRHGLNLLMGPGLWPCPTTGGLTEADFALRQEVRAVDELDRTALAAAGVEVLNDEIEHALERSYSVYQTGWSEQLSEELGQLELDHGPAPLLPLPTALWRYRQPALKHYVGWLLHKCGLTQAEAARIINAAGHRTPQGRDWQQATVSALIRGGYDRGAAA